MISALWLVLACDGDDVGVHNQAPEISIVSPAEFDTFTEGFDVPFEVIAGDDLTPLEDLSLLWVSDLDGELEGETAYGERITFVSHPLGAGQHVVTLLAADEAGSVGEASVTVNVIENTAPELVILAPDPNSAYAEGSAVSVEVQVSDDTEPALPALALSWSVDGTAVDGPTSPDGEGLASVAVAGLDLGTHLLRVTAVDTPGLAGWAEVDFDLVVPDADGDGYETDRLGGEDCDDTDVDVSPDAAEVCDDADTDEDCNGVADDADPGVADPVERYVDDDADGFGGDEVLSCESAGHSEVGGDCDDGDPAVHPDALEVCDDGIDNDCDGAATGCRLGGGIDLYAADTLFYGEGSADELGWSIAVGDLDGDGLEDLAMGARSRDAAESDAGAVFVHHGYQFGEVYLDGSAVEWTGTGRQDRAGTSQVALGDLDGDGLDELLVGAPNEDTGGVDAGAAYLLYGPVTVGGSLPDAGGVFWGEDGADHVGWAVGAAGDVDADGVPDLLIGADDEDSIYGEGGAGYLVLGPVSGSMSLADANAKFRAEDANDHLGTALTGVGDTNNDGYDDMLLASPDEDENGTGAGAAYLVLGDVTATWSSLTMRVNSADAKLVGPEAGAGAGGGLHGPGDIDGDGYAEVVVGCPSMDDDTGRAFLLSGPFTGTQDLSGVATTTFVGADIEARTGFALTSGDYDGDGELDLVIGAHELDAAAADSGTSYLLYGPWALGEVDLGSAADAVFDGGGNFQQAGYSSGTGDLDGDGKEDLVLGIPGEDTGANNAGAVVVFWGRGM